MRILVTVAIALSVAIPVAAEGEGVDHIIETRTEFFDRLNLDLPALATVREAVEAGDLDGAAQAYLDFFRSREFDHVSFRDFGERNQDYENRYADEAVALKITEYGTCQFDDPIDWRQPGMVTVCRFPQLKYLIPAFYHTRDPKYAEAMIRDFRSYLDAWPMSDARDISAQWLVHSKIDPEANPWSPVMVTHRTLRWLEALRYLREYEGLEADLLVDVVTRMAEDLEWVLPQIESLRMNHNFAFAMIKYALFTSQLLDEFDRSPVWNARSRDLFARWMAEYYYPDGGPKELTLAYGTSVVQQTNVVDGLIGEGTGGSGHMASVGLGGPELVERKEVEHEGRTCVEAIYTYSIDRESEFGGESRRFRCRALIDNGGGILETSTIKETVYDVLTGEEHDVSYDFPDMPDLPI